MRRIWICVFLALMLMLPCVAEEGTVEAVVPIGGGEEATSTEGDGGGSFVDGLTGYFEQFGDYTVEDWEGFVRDEVMPVVTLIITAVASIYIAISPVLYKVKTSAQRFHAATDGVNTATADVAEVKQMTAEAAESFNARYELIREECNELRRELATMLADVSKQLAEQYEAFREAVDGKVSDTRALAEQIERMLLVGLCNQKELVEKGYSHEIARIALGGAAGEEVSGHGEEVGDAE